MRTIILLLFVLLAGCGDPPPPPPHYLVTIDGKETIECVRYEVKSVGLTSIFRATYRVRLYDSLSYWSDQGTPCQPFAERLCNAYIVKQK